MNIVVLSGSPRDDSQSLRVAQYIEQVLGQNPQVSQCQLIDINRLPLEAWNAQGVYSSQWQQAAQQLQQADGAVFVCPEWDGMVPPAFKSFLQVFGAHLFHTPVLAIAVSAGFGGAYSLVELRTSAFKNARICYIPEQIIIRQVQEVQLPAPIGDRASEFVSRKIDYGLTVLLSYSAALAGVAERLRVDDPILVNNM